MAGHARAGARRGVNPLECPERRLDELGGEAGALLALELQAAQRRVGRDEVGDRAGPPLSAAVRQWIRAICASV